MAQLARAFGEHNVSNGGPKRPLIYVKRLLPVKNTERSLVVGLPSPVVYSLILIINSEPRQGRIPPF